MDLAIIILFMLANIVIGWLAGKNIKTLDHFSVGNRSFNSFVIFATLSASFIGGGYTLGNASKVYSIGLIYAFALLGFSVKEILVACFIAPRMDKYRDCLSIGDIIGKRYGTAAKVCTGVFSLIVCAGILGAQVGAMGAVFNTFFSIKPLWGIIIGFTVIILYSSLGGMRAVVFTDVLQFCILAIGIPLVFVMGLIHIGGFKTIIETVPHHHLAFLNNSHEVFMFIALFFAFMLGETLVPPYVQRLFMTKTSKQTVKATLASGIMSIPFFLIAGGIGLIAYVLNPHIDPNNALPYVVKQVLPIGIKGFVIAAIIAIIMSSAAGFLNAASVAFTNDIVKPLSKNRCSEKMLLWLAKISTLFVGIGSILFALTIKNILSILLYAYNFWSPIILVPLVATIFGIPATKRNFFAGAVAGITAVVIWTEVLHTPEHISGVVIGVLANLIFFSLDYFWTRKSRASTDNLNYDNQLP